MVKVKVALPVIEQKDKINLKKHDGSHKKARQQRSIPYNKRLIV